jgi:predicted dehydrogenase
MQRREFLGAAGLAAAQHVIGANDRVTVGLIGCGGRGRYVAGLMREGPGVDFAATADVYLPNAERAKEWAGTAARSYQDFRRLLEQKDIDAVLVATPDHWHAAIAVLACQAGKDVYVEKPLAHNVREGRAIVNAARRYNRIVQAGTQHRSSPHFREVQEIVQSGALGKVNWVRVWNYANLFPQGIGREPDSEPPAGLDWDFYLGPAPLVPYNRKRFTYRWFWDYSGGYITDFGTHRLDTVQQVMGVSAPQTIAASGGRFSLQDAGEIPDVLQVTYEYPGFVLSYESCWAAAPPA